MTEYGRKRRPAAQHRVAVAQRTAPRRAGRGQGSTSTRSLRRRWTLQTPTVSAHAFDAQGGRAARRRDDVPLHVRPGQGGAARPDVRPGRRGSQRTRRRRRWRERLERIAHENWWRYHRHPWLLEITMAAPSAGAERARPLRPRARRRVDGIGLTDVEMDAVVSLLAGHVEGAARRPRGGPSDEARAERSSGRPAPTPEDFLDRSAPRRR